MNFQDPEEHFALPQAPVQPAKAASALHMATMCSKPWEFSVIFVTNQRENQPEMEFNGFYPLVNIKATEHGHVVSSLVYPLIAWLFSIVICTFTMEFHVFFLP